MTTPAEYFAQMEARDGVRFSWNVFPSSRIEATRMAVPVCCVYTPLRQLQNTQPVQYPPIFCKAENCGSVLNPYCRVNFMSKLWICPFCEHRNRFPHHYSNISSENRPIEIQPQSTTLEYIIDSKDLTPPTFLFVIDTCLLDEELEALRDAIIQNMTMLPEDARIGLITFGKNVHVHELSFEECPKAHIIRGTK
jgi:protein transport protein SEC23